MPKTEEFDFAKNNEELLDSLFTFHSQTKKSRAEVKKTYLKNEPELYATFRITLDALLVRISKKLAGKIVNPTKELSYQYNLLASFVRTHFLINTLIFHGDLIEAHTLIRKQMETLTRLHELDKKPLIKLQKKTPNVLNVFGTVGKGIYPDLSEIAHFSTNEVAKLIEFIDNNGDTGPTLVPIYKDSALICYKRHGYISLYFAYWLIEFLKKRTIANYKSLHDDKTLTIITRMGIDCNIIQIDKETN
jgi:hypothetical protein